MILPSGATHYFPFRHGTASLLNTAFTKLVICDGQPLRQLPVSVREVSSKNYVASFTNQGVHNSQYTLIVYETAAPTSIYTQHWIVQDPVVELGIAFLKARNQIIESQLTSTQDKIDDNAEVLQQTSNKIDSSTESRPSPKSPEVYRKPASDIPNKQ